MNKSITRKDDIEITHNLDTGFWEIRTQGGQEMILTWKQLENLASMASAEIEYHFREQAGYFEEEHE